MDALFEAKALLWVNFFLDKECAVPSWRALLRSDE
jgi:hypothetical protein